DAAGVRVQMDGQPLADDALTRAVRVNPGAHVMRYELGRVVEESILLREGEGVRVLEVSFAAPAAERRDRPRRPAPAVYAFGAAAAVAFGVFGYFGVTAGSDYRRLEHDCAPHCPESDVSSVRTRLVVADVALIAGVLFLGGAAAALLLGRH